MENQFNFEVISDEELMNVNGGDTWHNILDGVGLGSAVGGAPGAILGGVLGWALTPTHVS